MCERTLATPRPPAPATVWRLLTEISGWPHATVRAPAVQLAGPDTAEVGAAAAVPLVPVALAAEAAHEEPAAVRA